ncbi:ubiquinol cytochrome C oxidoreductase, cytochrome C1 subunit [Thioalkalivibrio nitratireducens DSM 14787]|uniref:Ubiquinol cytochrome C oxidoreductase, cytochrome C1 subunit n=1 Tax=Thioalkalivibrio nitratireducens (strain DSM 14787 / UNIQEM 213 / ALEN2) TaxID=1255043 RepID=L0E0T1_THIND|nr:cytochrome c1 [Thioalkalivibrio nitratireducens]AGA34261.1 ubiquinol cytochrome C oxidoreductase, cytochrome C1 subunit [Thioalkalivibrio nitratireducens DSM 14787]
MKPLIAILALAVLALGPVSLQAAGPAVPLDRVNVDVTNQASLQRGAQLFFNYCVGCHSAQYMRYSRVGDDLGLTENQLIQSMIFTTDEEGELVAPGSLITNAMTAAYGEEAFGIATPDLTLVARVRGQDWLYSFLRSFYLDESRPLGVNNAVFENVGMPHPLWELQGWQEKHVDREGNVRLQVVEAGMLSGPEYDRAIRDLVTFLSYLAEPMQAERQRIGMYVMLFLLVFLGFAYLLKKEYWKDVH